MSGQFFFSLLNPMVAFFIAGVFALLLRRWPNHTHLFPVSLAFAYLGLAFLTQDFHLLAVPGRVNFAGNVFFVSALLLACCGALVRAGVTVPMRSFAGICLVTAIIFVWYVYGDYSLLGRILTLSVTFIALLSVTITLLLLARPKGLADHLFIAATGLALALSVLRPILVVSGVLDINQGGDFLASEYWANIQAFTPMISIVVATLFALAMAADIAEDLRIEADHDYLTGLLNRRGFENAARALLDAAPAGQGPDLLLADIDDFKQINDRFGHKVGDQVIATLGRLLSAHGGATLASRIGGEEFALFYAEADLAELAARASAIRQALRHMKATGLSASYRLTLSMGLHCRAESENLDAMLIRADRALYRAKDDGKDRAVATPACQLRQLA